MSLAGASDRSCKIAVHLSFIVFYLLAQLAVFALLAFGSSVAAAPPSGPLLSVHGPCAYFLPCMHVRTPPQSVLPEYTHCSSLRAASFLHTAWGAN